jgi:hypothetical protein
MVGGQAEQRRLLLVEKVPGSQGWQSVVLLLLSLVEGMP